MTWRNKVKVAAQALASASDETGEVPDRLPLFVVQIAYLVKAGHLSGVNWVITFLPGYVASLDCQLAV